MKQATELAIKQPPRALQGIWIIMSLVPIGGYVVMLYIMSIYKLDEKEVARMMELNRDKAENGQ